MNKKGHLFITQYASHSKQATANEQIAMCIDGQLLLAQDELRKVKGDRTTANKLFRLKNQEQVHYLEHLRIKGRKFLKQQSTIRMEDYYSDNKAAAPPRNVLNRQSMLLTSALRRQAQKKDNKRALKSNKKLVTYMMCEKYALEDEKMHAIETHTHLFDVHAKLTALLKQRYIRRLQVQRMVLHCLECKLDLMKGMLQQPEHDDIPRFVPLEREPSERSLGSTFLKDTEGRLKHGSSTAVPLTFKQNSRRRFMMMSSKEPSESTLSLSSTDSFDADLSFLMESELEMSYNSGNNSNNSGGRKARRRATTTSFDFLSSSMHGLSVSMHGSSSKTQPDEQSSIRARRSSLFCLPNSKESNQQSLSAVPEFDKSYSVVMDDPELLFSGMRIVTSSSA